MGKWLRKFRKLQRSNIKGKDFKQGNVKKGKKNSIKEGWSKIKY